MNKKELIDLIKASNLDKINIIYDDNKSFEINIKGTRKDMVAAKKEKGFNETQIKQLIEIINATVPNIVRKIIAEEVNPRLDKIENDIKLIKQCPTIARELKELESK